MAYVSYWLIDLWILIFFLSPVSRTSSILNTLLFAPSNCPLQYPIQGFTVRPLVPTLIPGTVRCTSVVQSNRPDTALQFSCCASALHRYTYKVQCSFSLASFRSSFYFQCIPQEIVSPRKIFCFRFSVARGSKKQL